MNKDKRIEINKQERVVYKRNELYEEWFDYDKKGNLIWGKRLNRKTKESIVYKYNYDENGNRIFESYSNGYIKRLEYDNKNQLIHTKDSNKFEAWYEYDDDGNEIYYRNSNGYEEGNRY